ncbi:MAG: hypothetical protein ACE37D_10825 [Pseudomonadales bacterium]|jgi:hypothetical protein
MKTIAFIALILGTNLAIADDQFQSALDQVCKASLISKDAARRTARELGVTRAQRQRLECNDMPMAQFAEVYSGRLDQLPAQSSEATSIVNIQ